MTFQAIPKRSGGSIHLTPDFPFHCHNLQRGRCTKGFLFCPCTTDNGVPGCFDQDITPREYDCPDDWILRGN